MDPQKPEHTPAHVHIGTVHNQISVGEMNARSVFDMLQMKRQELAMGNIGHVSPLKIVSLIVECVHCSQKQRARAREREFVCIPNLETIQRVSMCGCSVVPRFEHSSLRLIPN